MNSIVPLLEFKSTQELKDIVEKSRSRPFKDSQYVVADFSGTLNIQELAFYEVRRYVYMYVYVCMFYKVRTAFTSPRLRGDLWILFSKCTE
jgi:hypothetical protein